MPHPSSQFTGDYFGTDYSDTDFPFPQDDDNTTRVNIHGASGTVDEAEESGDEGSDSESENQQAQEKVWEPPRPHAARSSPPPSPMSRRDSPMNIDDRSTSPPAQQPLPADQDHLRQPPTYVDHFGGQAGSPISRPPRGTATGFDAYAQNVNENQSNPWAPFASRIDWEVAKWAKLRGSGSTAFSDLLAIEGVRSCSSSLSAVFSDFFPFARS